MLKNFSKSEEQDDDEGKMVDPVRWYGLLASQLLKDAQSRFVKGSPLGKRLMIVLEEGIEVANAMAKLRMSDEHILELRNQKSAGGSKRAADAEHDVVTSETDVVKEPQEHPIKIEDKLHISEKEANETE
jgi:hypothetical protein